jgi:hypothetical protein
MDIKYILSFPRENKVTVELFSEKKIIKNIMKNNEKHEIEDDSFVLVQRNNHIACFFFSYNTRILHSSFLMY